MLKTIIQSAGHEKGPSEENLVAGARTGDQAAVRELIRRLNPRLFRVARGIVDSDAEAEEVVQEAYMAAFTKIDTFRGDARFSTWITRIALNAAAMLRRSARSHESYDTLIEVGGDQTRVVTFPMTETERPEAAMARREVRDMLEVAIGSLPTQLRVVFLMHESEGMDIRSIARDLSLNPITVRTRLFWARRRMRALMEKEMAGGFASVFPFDGKRCHALTERTIQGLAVRGVVRR
ncbi:MAG: RNA polymerase subunit sigma [Rhizobiales bacterium]|nr:RNA polymerase subunit sigma [Hyphomicrobiales bacterium]